MGVETVDQQLLEKCLEFLTPAFVLERIEQQTQAGVARFACGFESLASVAPDLVRGILDKMDYIFQERGDSFPTEINVFSNLKEVSKINEPVVVIFLGLGLLRFNKTSLAQNLHKALGSKLNESIDPVNALCAEIVKKNCPKLIHPFFQENRQPNISFVILSGLNNAKILSEMLASFCDKTPPKPDIEVIVIVNGSNDESAVVPHYPLKNGYNYRVAHLPENLGIAGGYNEGISLARGKYVCLLQDDVLFEQKDWHRELAYYLDIYPEIGVMGGQQARFYFRLSQPRHAFEPPYISVGSDNWQPLDNFLVKVDAALCMAVMFRRELGFYDERFLPNGIEDIAFCFKARKMGWGVYATQVAIKHELFGERGATRSQGKNKVSLTKNFVQIFKKQYITKDSLNSENKKEIARRLSRAYHLQVFMEEYGDLLRELPNGRENITLDEIEKSIETLPKNWQRRD